jgi:transcriptional regulator with PAS, ATPase and Fis domain
MANHHQRPLIGWSAAMQDLRTEIDKTAPMDFSVMIQGERGTGKEIVAQLMHLKSGRANGPFIRVNSASFPDTLIDTELFGCERGAFTGAEFRKGKFELAEGGTLLLDEIGEISMTAQPKLLRVLQEREVDRIGGKHPIPVNFRLITSTNKNLKAMARNGQFREDLLDRLNQDSIRIPPLRERREDIPTLCEYFIGEFVPKARRLVTGIASQVLDLFQTYSWPGNVRELENIIRIAVFKGRSEEIRMDDLPFEFAEQIATARLPLGNHDELIQEYSRRLCIAALKHCRGNKTKAMKLLGVERTRFYRMLEKHGLLNKSSNNASGIDSEGDGHASDMLS